MTEFGTNGDEQFDFTVNYIICMSGKYFASYGCEAWCVIKRKV